MLTGNKSRGTTLSDAMGKASDKNNGNRNVPGKSDTSFPTIFGNSDDSKNDKQSRDSANSSSEKSIEYIPYEAPCWGLSYSSSLVNNKHFSQSKRYGTLFSKTHLLLTYSDNPEGSGSYCRRNRHRSNRSS